MSLPARLGVLALAPVALVAGLAAFAFLTAPEPGSDRLVRTVERPLVWQGDRFYVGVHAAGEALEPAARSTAETVTWLAIDVSGSMGSGELSPLHNAQEAAARFGEVVASESNGVGVMAFDHRVRVLQEASSDPEAVAAAARESEGGGGTDLAKAIDAARDKLVAGRDGGPRKELLVVLSDGNTDPQRAREAARRARAEGIRLIAVNLGGTSNLALLEDITSHLSDVRSTRSAADLGDIYLGIADDLELAEAIGYSGLLDDRVNIDYFELLDQPGGTRAQIDPSLGTLEVRLPKVYQATTSFRYPVEARTVGLLRPGLEPATLSYLMDPEDPDSVADVRSSTLPFVLVISPLLLLLLYLPFLVTALAAAISYLRGELEEELVPVVPGPGPLTPPPLVLRAARIPPIDSAPALYIGVGESGGRTIAELAEQLELVHREGGDPSAFHIMHVGPEAPPAPAGRPRLPASHAQMRQSVVQAAEQREGGELPDHLNWIPTEELRDARRSDLDISGADAKRWAARWALFEDWMESREAAVGSWHEAEAWLREHEGASVVVVGSISEGVSSGTLGDVVQLAFRAIPPESRYRTPVIAVGLKDDSATDPGQLANGSALLREVSCGSAIPYLPSSTVYVPEPRVVTPLGFGTAARWMVVPYEGLGEDGIGHASEIAKILSERSRAEQLLGHLGSVRAAEDRVWREVRSGTVHVLRAWRLVFPVENLVQRVACRMIMEVLGTGRLVAVRQDEADRIRPGVPQNASLADLLPLLESLDAEREPSAASVYAIYCRLAAERRPGDLPDELGARFGDAIPGLEAIRAELDELARPWLLRILNGPPHGRLEQVAPERAERISAVHSVLSELVGFDGEIRDLAEVRQPESGAKGIYDLIAAFHEKLSLEVQGWIRAIVGDSDSEGLIQRAALELARLRAELQRREASHFEIVLGDAVGNRELAADAVLERYVGPFLERESGLLSRFAWEWDAEGALRLRFVGCSDRVFGAEEAKGLYEELRELALALCADVRQLTILDKLRGDGGSLELQPLARAFASGEKTAPYRVAEPGCTHVVRRGLLSIPRLVEGEALRFRDELRSAYDIELDVVQHAHSSTIVLVEASSAVPVDAVRDEVVGPLPHVTSAERTAERLRRRIESELGIVPCPRFHPCSVRLLDGPTTVQDWIHVLAECDLVRVQRDDCREGLQLDGCWIVFEDEGVSWVDALVNLVYRRLAAVRSDELAARFRSRPTQERAGRLGRSAELWARRGAEATGAEAAVMADVSRLLHLEALSQTRAAG